MSPVVDWLLKLIYEDYYQISKIFFPIADQEEHIPILEMAFAIKYVNKYEQMSANRTDVDATTCEDDVIISLTADLQQLQDEETRNILQSLPEKVSEQ